MNRRIALTVGAAVCSLLVIAACGVLLGVHPATMLASCAGAFGSYYAVGETLVKSCPLLLLALAVIIAFRAGAWNIGGEGQLIVGAVAALCVAQALPEGPLAAILGLMAGAAAGAIWAGIAAALRVTRNAPEVLTTILLNFVAEHFLGFLINGPLQEGSGKYPESEAVAPLSWLMTLSSTRLHVGVVLAVVLAGAMHYFLFYSAAGLRIRAVGLNPRAARYVGIPVDRSIFGAMLASGALAGLAGSVELLGVTHRLFERFGGGLGYSGIAVALLAFLQPLAAIPSAIFFAGLARAAGELQRTAGISSAVALLGQGVAVLVALTLSAPRFSSLRVAKAPASRPVPHLGESS
ncbi:MAG TPA: ABC transporter permease [Thermoanaerobaculia bacterium]|nr:ABC transporter permease [Thermoanaerobaculia bacterium]